jgi:hypothetical protein
MAYSGMRSTVMEIQNCEGFAYIQFAAPSSVVDSLGIRVWED